jgi:hypothetical protein
VLWMLDGGVDLWRVGPSQGFRGMCQRKVERIGGKEECGAHRWRRNRPTMLEGASDSVGLRQN